MNSYQELQAQIREFLGVMDPPSEVTFHILQEEEREDYTQRLVAYQASEGDTITAFLLLPKGAGPFPAVLVHHQHNGQRHLGKSEPAGLAGDPLQAFGPALVQRGFVVLAPDSICFEDRRTNRSGTEPDDEGDWLQHYNEMCYKLLRGEMLMTRVLNDALIAGTLLQSLPEVDSQRLGLLGHSYGGQTVIFQGAIDERFSYACTSGSVCSFADKMKHGTGIEMAAIMPGFLERFEMADLLTCFIPRKLLVVSATEDKYSKDADSISDEIADLYGEHSFNFTHKRYKGGHALTQERFDFINEWMCSLIG